MQELAAGGNQFSIPPLATRRVPPSAGNPLAAGNGDTASRTDEIDVVVLQLPFNHRICVHCRLCAVCACQCHDKFELRCRFEPTEDTVRSNSLQFLDFKQKFAYNLLI